MQRNSWFFVDWTAFLGWKRRRAVPFARLVCALFFALQPAHAGYQTSQAIDAYHRAKSAFDRGNSVSADTNLRLALQQLPNFSEAYLLKGLMAYTAGQIDEAQKAFNRAGQLIARLPSAERDALDRQVADARKGLSQKAVGAFRVQVHGTVDPQATDAALKHLQDALDDYAKRYGFSAAGPIRVLIFSANEFWDEWGIPWWTHHYFDQDDGKIRFPVGPLPGGDAELNRRLRYELMRVELESLPAPAAPAWFQTGLGLYEARRTTDAGAAAALTARLSDLRAAVAGAPAGTGAALDSALREKGTSEGTRYFATLDSEGLVTYLVRQKGEAWVTGVISRLIRHEPFEGAFTQETGLSPAAALGAWRTESPQR